MYFRSFFQSRPVLLIGSSVLSTVTTFSGSVALCEGESWTDKLIKKDKQGSIDWNSSLTQVTKGPFWNEIAIMTGNRVQTAIDTGVPTQVSYGFVSGYCSGFALKKVGRAVAGVLGLGFLVLQTLSYQGYVTVDHNRLKKEVEGYLDFNKDGKIDQADGEIATKKVMEVLQFNLPAGSGFGVGFIGGLRSG